MADDSEALKKRGARLRELRQSRKDDEGKPWTQDVLAERSTVPQPLISKYEAGRQSMTVETAQKLASALGCEVAELLGAATRTVDYDSRYPNSELAAEVFRREARALGLDAALVERTLSETLGAVHDRHGLPPDSTTLQWFEHFKAVANGIRYAEKYPTEEKKRSDADAARVAEMEEATRPKLKRGSR